MVEVRGAREALLDSAYDAAIGGDWDRVRMADVAKAAGVSRQTLYNEFASKEGLSQALTMREAERFLGVVDAAVTVGTSAAEAVRATVLESLTAAESNPLVKAALAGAHSSQLLRFLTTDGEGLIHLADDRLTQGLLRRFPHLAPAAVEEVSDVVVRLTISHLVSPDGPAERAARQIQRLVQPLLEEPA